MQKQEILEILTDWNFWHKSLETGIRRDSYLERMRRFIETGQIVVITGPRRAGKSYLLRQFAQDLILKGIPPKEILIVNFEDPRWVNLNLELLQKIYEVYLEYLVPSASPYIFLDEVQEVKDWERWVRTCHELKKAKIIISGSNSKLLSRELATLLSGRHLDIIVFPLSFKEFLSFNGLTILNETDLIAKRVEILRFLRIYLEFGSFPNVALQQEKKEILLTYFDDIINRDLIKRYAIRKAESLKSLAKYYLSNIATLISFSSLEKTLELSSDTIQKFSAYLETAYLVSFLKRFSFKVKEQEKSPRKVYAIDTGLANAVGFRFSQNWGRLAENLVYLELSRKKSQRPSMELYYWKDSYHREVDFLVKEDLQVRKLIQVSWEVSLPKIQERELKSLVKAMAEMKIAEGIVLTEDYEAGKQIKDKKILFVPLWKWLMGNG